MNVQDIDPIDREEMVGLATHEYALLVALLSTLDPDDWERPTPCEGWRVRDMTAHLLGAAAGNASMMESTRQLVRGGLRVRGTDRPLVDGINEVQIEDRATLSPAQLVAAIETVADAAVRGRRRTPTPLRAIKVPGPLGAPLAMGELMDKVYTRDQWMHRIDITRATARPLLIEAAHDGRIVADIVRDWAFTHDEPVRLELTGPAGGAYEHRELEATEVITLDAIAFCLAVSGREPADGLLAVQIVF